MPKTVHILAKNAKVCYNRNDVGVEFPLNKAHTIFKEE
jgi:hypothetical protein